jgi:hypothetical protein
VPDLDKPHRTDVVIYVNTQERNRLSSASEAATRVKLKRQEVEAKEEELEDLLRSHRTRLLSVLGANGARLTAWSLRVILTLLCAPPYAPAARAGRQWCMPVLTSLSMCLLLTGSYLCAFDGTGLTACYRARPRDVRCMLTWAQLCSAPADHAEALSSLRLQSCPSR